jgi:hypothetical protein
LLDQIATPKEQIENNPAEKQSIKHLKDMILERELHLNEFLDVAKSTAPATVRQSIRGWDPGQRD